MQWECSLTWVSHFSAGDDFHLDLVPCWQSTMCNDTVEPYTLLWVKQQLFAWNLPPRPAWMHYTVNSHTCNRSELLCTHWTCELYRWRRFSIAVIKTSIWDFGDGNVEPTLGNILTLCFIFFIFCLICFKTLFQSTFSPISNEKPRTFCKLLRTKRAEDY